MNQERRIFLLFTMLSIAEASLYVTDLQMNRMIELTIKKPHCRMHTDRGTIQHVVLNMDHLKVRQVPAETVTSLEKVCLEGNQLSSEIQGGLSFIYPGTLWCGPGTIARNYSEIGRHIEEDKCCRAHDNCYPQIAPGECLKSICNKGQITRLHCSCDENFRKCLNSINSEISNILGSIFFNTVQVTCFQSRSPCSLHQRSQCDYAFYREEPFLFEQQRDDDDDSSENLVVAEARVGAFQQRYTSHENTARFFDPYSMRLILGAFYENFLFRPYRALTNFVIVTKTILFSPSTRLEEQYLISKAGLNDTEADEICSRFKFRPSSKYQSRPATGSLQNGLKRPQLI